MREGKVLTTASHKHPRLAAASEASDPTLAPLPAPTPPPRLSKDALGIIFFHANFDFITVMYL